MNQSVQIIPTTQATLHKAAGVLGRAFADEAVSLEVYRGLSADQRIRNLTADFTGELKACLRRGSPRHISQDGKLLAATVVYPPGAYPLPRHENIRLLFWAIWGHALYDVRKWLGWLEEADKAHPSEPHYYLEYIGVEPEYQGQGLGSRLLQHLVAEADAAQVGCYLETASPQNLPLYQRFGFQIIQEKEVIGLPAWFMWRPAPGHESNNPNHKTA